jgi:hypothetical protein
MRYAIIFALITAVTFSTQAAPPTDSSVDELLKCLQVDKLLNQSVTQMTDGMNNAMNQRLQATIGTRELTPVQKAAIDRFRAKFARTLQEDLSVAKVRAIYMQCYKETFSQDEVDGIIGFYKSPAGQAISEKFPQVMQKAQSLMQAKIGPLSNKVQVAMDEMTTALENSQKAEAPKKP